MQLTPFNRERLACAYFFAVPGLVYGIFTSRLPALKSMVSADDGQIGFLLLAFGAASFVGLTSSRRVLAAFGVKRILAATSIALALAMGMAAIAFNYWYLLAFCMLGGLVTGWCEVAMNAQGMMIEQRYDRLCMASLHACYSMGGMAGSLSGSAFAALELSPALNFFAVLGLYLFIFPPAFRNLAGNSREPQKKAQKGERRRIPLFIYLCGIMSMLCYVSEGSVGEWGSILLHSVKGAPQDEAALVFGCFCATMVVCRLLGDRLREIFGDALIVFLGGMLGAVCMSIVLLSQTTWICLLAYALMGIGFAPIVPILFSRAGRYPGISPARASSMVSIMSYTGLLVFPPFLGMLGDAIGLGNALWIISAACLGIALGSPFILKKH